MNNLLDKYRNFLEGTSRASGVIGSELTSRSEPQERLSPSTVKNYLSDTRHFLNFLASSLNKTNPKATDITPKLVSKYQQSLASAYEQVVEASQVPNLVSRSEPKADVSSEPHKVKSSELTSRSELNQVRSKPSLATINRRLSSLRRFGHFLFVTKLLPTNPTTHLTNLKNTQKSTTIRQILDHYTTYLKSEALTESTIKNYLSDLNHYLLWAKDNHQLTDNQPQVRLT